MGLKIGTSDVITIYLGTTPVSRITVGGQEIPVPVPPTGVPSNQIWYYTNDNNVVDFGRNTGTTRWGANIVSNTSGGGKCVITFDGNPTKVYFDNQTSVTDIKIPDSVTEFKYIYGTLIEHLHINSNITVAPNGSKCNGMRLRTITVDTGNTIYTDGSFGAYSGGSNCLISGTTLIVGSSNSVIPEGVEKLANYAFTGRLELTGITIPHSVTEISGAFSNCTNLTNISYSGTVEDFNLINISSEFAFSGIPATVVHCTNGDWTIPVA